MVYGFVRVFEGEEVGCGGVLNQRLKIFLNRRQPVENKC